MGDGPDDDRAMSTESRSPALSPVTGSVAVVFIAGGLITGLVMYLHRSSAAVHTVPGTSAWGIHLGLTVVAAAWLAAAHHRRRPGPRVPLLLAPIGTNAAHRLAVTARSAPLRVLACAPLLALLAYNAWRAGAQVFGGLDPHFRANAWGGPSYLGAMYCHYLDIGLISALAAIVIDRLLLDRPNGKS
jgi:hypothetical protein